MSGCVRTRLLAILCAVLFGQAAAAAEFAAIVIDARNGAVLYERNADARLHPASLTKMMTAYLTFEAVRDGRLKLDQRVTISRNAAREPPSRIGLKQGQRVRVRDLLRAAVVKSANDAATALGEAIAGSEKAFAQRMTSKARALGMTQTRFRNANGLTRNGHLSTARDMAILSRHLLFDFPQYYNLFGRTKTPAMGITIRNTNRLLRSYDGADGIKTGYTRAAGFNLAASAKRGSERVIVVVFGARSSRERNRKVASLLDLGFRKAPSRVQIVPPGTRRLDPLVYASLAPPRRGTPPETLLARSVDAVAKAVASPAAAATLPATLPATRPDVARPVSRPVSRPVARAVASAHAVAEAPRPLPRPKGVPGLQRDQSPADWAIQLGAYKQRGHAEDALATAARAALPVLQGTRQSVDATVIRGLPLFQALLSGLTEAAALAACEALRDARLPCRPRPITESG